MPRWQGWTGSQILFGTLLLAIVAVAVATASPEGEVPGDTNDAINEFFEDGTSEEMEQVWEEGTAEPKAGTSTLTQEAATSSKAKAPPITNQMANAAAAVAVAKKLLEADKLKANALINKAEASGKVSDQQKAAAVVNEARRLGSSLLIAQQKLAKATHKVATLPVSTAALQKEVATKKKHALDKQSRESTRKSQQKAYEAQYGVKSTCKKECTNEKVCEEKKCTPKYKTACLQAGPAQCVSPRTCTKHEKKCAQVDTCLKKGPEQCDFHRTCSKQEHTCVTKQTCVKEHKECSHEFTQQCVDCAKTVDACQKARETADDCGPACKSQCAGDAKCLVKCSAGCQTMYDGFLAACKSACPGCLATNDCKSTCLQFVPKKDCGMHCTMWNNSTKKVCHHTCLEHGHTTECNDKFCTEYALGTPKCDPVCIHEGKKPAGQDCRCTKYSAVERDNCKDSCSYRKCDRTCQPTFHRECKEFAPMRCHRPRKCAVPLTRKCQDKRKCASYGPKTCKHKTKCLAYQNKCNVETQCVSHSTSCAKEFSPKCVACASKSHACIAARKSSETCLLKCQQQCGEDPTCQHSCHTGCQTMQAGFLSSCKHDCPSCSKKEEVCQTTCKETKQVNVCKKTCAQEQELPEQHCFKPCLKYGIFKSCDDHFCSEYTYGDHVCEKPCVNYQATATKWCQPKCENVLCKKLCAYEPEMKCTKFEKKCKSETCSKHGRACTTFDACLVFGKKHCTDSSKCLKHEQKCDSEAVCVNNTTKCEADTSECDACRKKTSACSNEDTGDCAQSCATKCGADANCKQSCMLGCHSINAGFSSACKSACPVCDTPKEVCHDVCTKTKVQKTCKQVCTQRASDGPRQCVHGQCLVTARTKKCDEHACLEHSTAPEHCEQKCVEYTSSLKKVCDTDCSPDPADTYDAFKKKMESDIAYKSNVEKCEEECYGGRVVCKINELDSCTGKFQKSVTECIAGCRSNPGPVTPYQSCMKRCDTSHSLKDIMQCHTTKCAGRSGAELDDCKQQCYEPRGRCRCACDTQKEYVCVGAKCECREAQSGGTGGAKRAAIAVADAAQDSADSITVNPPSKNLNEGIGAQSAAAAAAAAAAKFGGGDRASAEGGVMSQEQAEKARIQEERALKQAKKSKEQLRSIMSKGAHKAAFAVAANTTHAPVDVQHEETLLAAKTGAKRSSADMVTSVVKLAAIAASKAAKVDAIRRQLDHKAQHHRVTAAAKAAVKGVIQPIMAMINEVAKEAAAHAIERYPTTESLLSSFALSPKAQQEIHHTAKPPAVAAAKKWSTHENKEALLNDVTAAAAKVAEPKVLSYVKELATKAATHSRSHSLSHNSTVEAATSAAKASAARVATEALRIGKKIIHDVSVEAVEHAITDHLSIGGNGKTSQEKVAKDVKNALDKGGQSTEVAAKQTAKEAIMKNIHRNAAAASNEAKKKGKSQENQAVAASNAAADAIGKGRKVQKVVDRPEVNVKVKDAMGQKNLMKKESAPSNMGTMVLETIESSTGKQKVSHLQRRLEKAAVKAAESAADEAAKQLKGFAATKDAARQAARVAAKSSVLAEVKDAATLAAQKAKERLADRDLKSQEDGASAAASQAAKHVLKIAKGIVDKVSTASATKAMKLALKESSDSDDASDSAVEEDSELEEVEAEEVEDDSEDIDDEDVEDGEDI